MRAADTKALVAHPSHTDPCQSGGRKKQHLVCRTREVRAFLYLIITTEQTFLLAPRETKLLSRSLGQEALRVCSKHMRYAVSRGEDLRECLNFDMFLLAHLGLYINSALLRQLPVYSTLDFPHLFVQMRPIFYPTLVRVMKAISTSEVREVAKPL